MEKEANHQMNGVPIGLTQCQVVLPSQYFGRRGKEAPEQRLMIAVLHDALDCIKNYRFATTHRGRQLFRAAKQ